MISYFPLRTGPLSPGKGDATPARGFCGEARWWRRDPRPRGVRRKSAEGAVPSEGLRGALGIQVWNSGESNVSILLHPLNASKRGFIHKSGCLSLVLFGALLEVKEIEAQSLLRLS